MTRKVSAAIFAVILLIAPVAMADNGHLPCPDGPMDQDRSADSMGADLGSVPSQTHERSVDRPKRRGHPNEERTRTQGRPSESSPVERLFEAGSPEQIA